MFWWLYHSPQRVDNDRTPWPTVLWLQGGPVSDFSSIHHTATAPRAQSDLVGSID
jgi:hypothetical protein